MCDFSIPAQGQVPTQGASCLVRHKHWQIGLPSASVYSSDHRENLKNYLHLDCHLLVAKIKNI